MQREIFLTHFKVFDFSWQNFRCFNSTVLVLVYHGTQGTPGDGRRLC